MKRIFALTLCLIFAFSLCACGVEPGETGETPNFTEVPAVTLPDGSTVYSEEPFVEFPQTGEYKETALLTNVPGQGVPLLLDMREDGTIDYIFGTSTRGFTSHYDDRGIPTSSFKENGVKYYTIAPDGTATLHDEKWIEEIDHYVEMTNTAANIENGKWIFRFAAEEGTILILGQFGPNLYAINEMVVTVLFKIQNDMVTIVPIDYIVEYDGQLANWRAAHITDMRLENGYVFFESGDGSLRITPDADYFRAYATYQLNGTLSDIFIPGDLGRINDWSGSGLTSTVIFVNPEGKICTDEVYWPAMGFHYTENDTLYNLGKYGTGRKNRANISMTTFENPGESFCCWFDQGGQSMLIRYDHNPEGAIEPEVLTVWSLEPIDLIRTAVVEWNHTHASPIFRYVTAAEELEGTNLTQEDYMTRLNLELLNNQGPDVMILDGLNVEKYMDFMVPLDSLNTAGVYENILERFTVSGKLMALPARAVPYLLGRQTEGTQQIQSLTQFADMVTTATDVLDVPNYDMIELYYDYVNGAAPYYVNNYNQVFRLWYPAWADAIWEDGKLNKDVFIEFLTQTTRLVDHYTLGEPGVHEGLVYHESTDTAYMPTMDETDLYDQRHQPLYTLAAPGYVGLDAYWYDDWSMRNDGKIIPHYIEHIPGPDGTGVMVPTVITGVRAGGHEEAGLEFVQILLSREMQLGWTYHGSPDPGYPVIWEYVEDLIRKDEIDKKQVCAVQNDYEETITNLRTVIIDEYLFEAALIAAQSCYRTESRLTPEEAAEALYEATRIYLAEQR